MSGEVPDCEGDPEAVSLDWGIFEPNSPITEITNEPEAQIERLSYLLAQGVKEGLVPHPSKWPGVHSAKALLTGRMKLDGLWIRRSDLYEVNRRKSRAKSSRARRRRVSRKSCEDRVSLELSPLPCWAHLSPAEIAERTRELVSKVLVDHREARQRVPRDYRKRLMDRSRFMMVPKSRKREEKPKVHAASFETWIEWVKNWESWLRRYERASQRLRSGCVEALDEFPEGSFIPTGLWMEHLKAQPPPA